MKDLASQIASMVEDKPDSTLTIRVVKDRLRMDFVVPWDKKELRRSSEIVLSNLFRHRFPSIQVSKLLRKTEQDIDKILLSDPNYIEKYIGKD